MLYVNQLEYSHVPYMLIVASDGREVKLLDPNYSPAKFQAPGREGKVRVEEPFVFCSIETLMQETRSDTKFYLLKR